MKVPNHLPMDELTIHHAKLCQALADPKRIQILYALDGHPRHVSGLAEDLNIPQPTVSRHLRILRKQALVTGRRDGPAVFYKLRDRRIIKALNTVHEILLENIANQY
jgi:ArsR family transcriptional regulator